MQLEFSCFHSLTLWCQWWGTPSCRWFWCSWRTCRCWWNPPSDPPGGWPCRCHRKLEEQITAQQQSLCAETIRAKLIKRETDSLEGRVGWMWLWFTFGADVSAGDTHLNAILLHLHLVSGTGSHAGALVHHKIIWRTETNILSVKHQNTNTQGDLISLTQTKICT